MSVIHRVTESPVDRRDAARYVAAGASLIAAGIYYLIGFDVIAVVTDAPATASIFLFGTAVGTVFLLAATVLLLSNRRLLWALVAVFQVLALSWYIAVAPLRDPPFEVWGLLLSLMNLIVLVATIWMGRRPLLRPGQTLPEEG